MTKVKRTDRHEPMPEEVLGYIADATSEIEDDYFRTHPESGYSYPELELAKQSITLAAIREKVASVMAAKKEYFTSAYRHANGGLHGMVYRILGGTVSLNDLIHQKQQQKGEKAS